MRKLSRANRATMYTGLIIVGLLTSAPTTQASDQEKLAYKLTMLFRSARALISKNKSIIADPTTMKFTPEQFVEKSKKNYKKVAGTALDESSKEVKALLQAIREVAADAKSGKYSAKWPEGSYANKFLPARFAREIALKFNTLSGGAASIKLTAPSNLLVNPDNKADTWESNVIDTKFSKTGWAKDKAFFEVTDYNGKSAFRYMIPEYYNNSCMKCHGGEAGKSIHSGGIEGKNGSLGGAISIAL